ncbi:3-deoxy-manno-octulosonate cytidylyltransferase [Mariprofundus micogutta]|uniref:3-deoxy-manno-octulosonate cytidylyltransferase n=1 Tax=Mariprofundus micogutta TaxID=1921010 RepID=A0A1L8CNA1_9PROT|nr:3-deoxy-manno-octulosonate cytidylyltransferase [Mariprofundus micogutta]GAV20309.1 3-deoxy-manno-octulosonate cytidylyltransferase [Mariprofundus micogutta]
MKIAIGIPARMGSTRFPGKPLAELAGKPMIQHVIEKSLAADLGPVFVATDDERIAKVARDCGVIACMTRPDHPNGSNRLAEAVREIACDVVVNVQGDEPLIDPAAIRAVVEPFNDDAYLPMATLAHPLRNESDLFEPNVVKLVCNARGRAMYFSRAAIPYPRSGSAAALQHVGLYAYRKEFLLIYASMDACEAEETEQLEQLRVLHHGYDIAVTVGDFHCIGVDTPEDLARAEALLNGK